ncbi:MAG TPA: glycosyltransferase family 2 protein [Kofleriaceae bacterium]|nr:glycosyltransferase family 2 protein [Kofleriaceae bacterium]
MPAFNEAATVADVIGRVPTAFPGVSDVRVVVVDDGSSDDTAGLARRAGAIVVRHPRNLGVGIAFHSQVRAALRLRADLLVTIDADGQFNPADIGTLIQPILDGEALVCTASRFADHQLVPEMPWVKKWGNRRVSGLVSRMTGEKFHDVSCGFRAYSREALLQLTVRHSFTYTHETFLDLAAKRIPIREVPLPVRGTREHGKSKVAKSVVRYGMRTAAIMLRTYRDQRPLSLCFALSVPCFLAGVAMLIWSYGHLVALGTWIKWAAFAGGGAIALGFALLFFGFMADIATRLRQNQEEILYWLRRQATPEDLAREMPSSSVELDEPVREDSTRSAGAGPRGR